MTREEALQIIYDHCQHCDETEKAFEILKENKGDLISRQAVLDIWHTSYSNIRVEDEEIKYKKIAFELPSVENKGEWIPVTKRLPEESQTEDGYFYPSDMVLTFNSHGQYGVSRYWGNRISKKERPNDYLDWMDLPFYRQDILAWQPLPEPYKERGE